MTTDLALPKAGELWRNNRRQITYRVVVTAKWSDTPNTTAGDNVDELEDWVCVRNISTGKCFVRSFESFLGINRDGQPRFTKLDEF